MKQLHTARAYDKPLQVVLQTASELDKELNEWRDALPAHLRLGSGDYTLTHCCTRDMHIIYLHCAYYASLIGIHSCFTQPWSPIYDKMRASSLREQLNRSTEIVDDASRSLILLTKSAPSLHAATPLWIAMHFPLLGMINLFVRVIKDPEAASSADVALLDVVCGHLAQLEFASSGTVTFSFAREVARISRAVIRTQQTGGRALPPADKAQQTDYSTSPANTIQAGEPNESVSLLSRAPLCFVLPLLTPYVFADTLQTVATVRRRRLFGHGGLECSDPELFRRKQYEWFLV